MAQSEIFSYCFKGYFPDFRSQKSTKAGKLEFYLMMIRPLFKKKTSIAGNETRNQNFPTNMCIIYRNPCRFYHFLFVDVRF